MLDLYLGDLLITDAVNYGGMSGSDLKAEIDAMFLRNKAASDFYDQVKNGTLSKGALDEIGDILNENSVNPYEWLEHINDGVEVLLSQHIPYEI